MFDAPRGCCEPCASIEDGKAKADVALLKVGRLLDNVDELPEELLAAARTKEGPYR